MLIPKIMKLNLSMDNYNKMLKFASFLNQLVYEVSGINMWF